MTVSLHHGQVCFSTERILVQESIASEFLELLKAEAPSHDPGHPITQSGLTNPDSLVQKAIMSGAKALVGGTGLSPSKLGLKPTILTGVEKHMAISDQETFGPSASLYTFKTDEEAIQMANDSEYGLNAAIHTTNMERAIRLARELEVGQVHINNLTEYDEGKYPVPRCPVWLTDGSSDSPYRGHQSKRLG